jgi:hypothetical protein
MPPVVAKRPMLRRSDQEQVNYPRIVGIGTAHPPIRQQSLYAAGYESERIRKIFLNSDIEYRHFFFGGTQIAEKTLIK